MIDFENILVEAPTKRDYQALSSETKARIELDFLCETKKPMSIVGNEGESITIGHAKKAWVIRVNSDVILTTTSRKEFINTLAVYL